MLIRFSMWCASQYGIETHCVPTVTPAHEEKHEIQRERRTSLVAVAALASSVVAAGCGGGGDSGEDDDEVTIWMSLDQPVQTASRRR